MGELSMWESAVPDGQRFLAAAPVIGDWRPRMKRIQLVTQGPTMLLLIVGIPSGSRLVLGICLAGYVIAFGVIAVWARRWRQHHPRPSGQAAILATSWRQPPVLLVTDSAVLLTSTQGPSLRSWKVQPGAARALPGLNAIEADRDLLVLSFTDGSIAALRQQAPKRGAAAEVAAEVAALAAPAIRVQREKEPAVTRRRPW